MIEVRCLLGWCWIWARPHQDTAFSVLSSMPQCSWRHNLKTTCEKWTLINKENHVTKTRYTTGWWTTTKCTKIIYLHTSFKLWWCTVTHTLCVQFYIHVFLINYVTLADTSGRLTRLYSHAALWGWCCELNANITILTCWLTCSLTHQ